MVTTLLWKIVSFYLLMNMKRIILALCALTPLFAFADIIVKKDSKTIEDVTIVSITADNVVYKQDGGVKTISAAEVDGVLYDDGRYVTPPSQQTMNTEEITTGGDTWATDDAGSYDAYDQKAQKKAPKANNSYDNEKVASDKEINILAYGKAVMNFYSADHEFDGAKVEYRVITKSNPNPEFEYLGTTPFAYLTAAEAKIMSGMDKKNAGIFEVRPLIVESGGTVEFRLSKDGYKTVVVRPMVKVDFGGRMIMIPLNKLKK